MKHYIECAKCAGQVKLVHSGKKHFNVKVLGRCQNCGSVWRFRPFGGLAASALYGLLAGAGFGAAGLLLATLIERFLCGAHWIVKLTVLFAVWGAFGFSVWVRFCHRVLFPFVFGLLLKVDCEVVAQ